MGVSNTVAILIYPVRGIKGTQYFSNLEEALIHQGWVLKHLIKFYNVVSLLCYSDVILQFISLTFPILAIFTVTFIHKYILYNLCLEHGWYWFRCLCCFQVRLEEIFCNYKIISISSCLKAKTTGPHLLRECKLCIST